MSSLEHVLQIAQCIEYSDGFSGQLPLPSQLHRGAFFHISLESDLVAVRAIFDDQQAGIRWNGTQVFRVHRIPAAVSIPFVTSLLERRRILVLGYDTIFDQDGREALADSAA